MADEPKNRDPRGGPAPAPGAGPARRRRIRILAVVSAIILAQLVGVPATSPAAADDGRPAIVVNGRGWGHGRGMGQYGTLGYVSNMGWSSARILDHYYGGTTAGRAPSPGRVDPANVRVDLVGMRGRATTVGLATGTLHLMTSDGSTIRRATGAVRLTVSGGEMQVSTAETCSGPWTTEAPIDRSLVRIEAETDGIGQAGLLHTCGPSYRTWYDGEIWATSAGGRQHSINLVSVEQYLRGVVPNEMPAGWPLAALEVQAVAARSYVLAGDSRWTGYADTCDTTTCQVYDGRYTTRAGWRISTHPRTDAAVSATAGMVRLTAGGRVARTEFSSSTGGYTAGGDFPAVQDDGDAVTGNRNHQWHVSVDLQSVENAANLGPLRGVAVTRRNGLGASGGRAITVEYRFRDGTVAVSGDSFRRRFGLKSDWFGFGAFSRGGEVVDSVDTEAIAGFIDGAFRRLRGRAPSPEEARRWQQALQRSPRTNLTRELVHSDHFAGVLVDELYLVALGRRADPDGRQYWVDTLAGGLKYEHLGTLFYGSPEYVKRAGNTNADFVASLYAGILGRDPDEDGSRYWTGLLRAGTASPADVANSFYRSVESRRDRSRSIYRRVMAAEPTAGQTERHAARLQAVDDLTLAAELAASLEFP